MMKKFINILSFLIVIWSFCFVAQVAPTSYYKFQCMHEDIGACANYLFIQSWENAKHDSYTTNINKQDWGYWKRRYLGKIQSKEDAYLAISTMLASLDDPYTRFLTPEELEDQNLNISAHLSGIGVVISSLDGKIRVEDIIESSPASKNGLKIGDIIVKVNNISVAGLDIRKVADMIRGKVGTKVKLIIIRNNKMITKTIVRENIRIRAVSFKSINKDIGYIKISTFMSIDAANEFLYAIKKLKNKKKLIVDLRGNQGGLLQNATFISNMLLDDGIIVSVIGKGNKKEVTKVQKSPINERRPMVILTNGLTASSSEILAAALQENDRAVLVGEKTYGKGLIQKITPLPFNTAMNITIAKYLTPKGHDINKNGIKPNYEVVLTMNDFKKANDVQLKKAIEVLEKL